jgi:putative tryptophan/tyrosine transport system substrate-binding protein
MRRREFVAGLGAAAATWPLAARAQKAAMPVVGFLSSRSPNESKHLVAAFRTGLQTGGGYVEGQNVAIEYRWRRVNMIVCRSWRPIWFAVVWRCS